ncbi:hypothetical protein N7495_007959 [Penicillium taxi]|uniref:uncharacterized protein n=1 Tax=Penicillium taxi TaxID=168475 RepID=UPI0025456026|nr:uncharacterized protein N7495_007959 [Penicillium taxi]KAJ5887918.1 hypothetical protein N7495_007959 [Penicillium taxi]
MINCQYAFASARNPESSSLYPLCVPVTKRNTQLIEGFFGDDGWKITYHGMKPFFEKEMMDIETDDIILSLA